MWDAGAVNHSPSASLVLPPGQRASACKLGEWSQWGSCMKKNKTCGFKKGSQSRVRSPLLQVAGSDASPPSEACAPQTEKKKCVVNKTPCARGKHKYKHGTESQCTMRSKWWPLQIQNSSYNQIPDKDAVKSSYFMKRLLRLMWWLTEPLLNIGKPDFPPVCLWPTACWLGLVWPRSQKDTEPLDFSACKQ